MTKILEPIIDIESACGFLRQAMPDWEWLLARIESEGGHFRFPPMVARAITNLRIGNYPLLYENDNALSTVTLRGLMSPEEFKSFALEVEEASPTERGGIVREFVASLDDFDGVFELPKTPAQERQALEAWNSFSGEEQKEVLKITQHLWMGFLSAFYQHLSVMVHGEKLTALVKQAKAGDDEAFCKAVQIDKGILTTIPYFKDRHARAGLQGETQFLEVLGRRLWSPPYKGKIRHKSLWLAFAFLDTIRLLPTLTHRELLDLCDDAGVGGYKNRIEDVKNLSKRLAEYRAFQRRGLELSTP